MFGSLSFYLSEISWVDREYDFGPDKGSFGASQTAKKVTRRNRMLPIRNRRRGDVGSEE